MSAAYRIVLTGGQETPPVVTSATGTGYAIFNSATNALFYSMNILGLDFGAFLGQPAQTPGTTADDVSGAHFHGGATGVPGGVILGFMSDGDFAVSAIASNGSRTVTGNWQTTDAPSITPFIATFSGAGALGSAIPVYANFHTVGHGGGEIRGQLILIATDASETVTGTSGIDVLPGLGGNDVINGFGSSDNLIGAAGADTLNGGGGADKLNGGTGIDVLTGGAGVDKFVFNVAPTPGNRDTITDYTVVDDTIQIENAIFAGIGGPGTLAAAAFHAGAAAADASDRIIYNPANGRLYYDSDGLGGAAQVQFATLSVGLALTAAEFMVI